MLRASDGLVRTGESLLRYSNAMCADFDSIALRVEGADGSGSACMPSLRWDRTLSWIID